MSEKYLIDDFKIFIKNYEDVISKLQGKKILITGAYGFLNSYLVKLLEPLLAPNNIMLYLQFRSKEKAKKILNRTLENQNVYCLDLNLEKPISIDIKFDYILHGASAASTFFFKNKPVEVIAPNTIGTWNLLSYAKENPVINFLMYSSNSIYGSYPEKQKILKENDIGVINPIGERSCYIESKRIAEQMCIAFNKEYGVNTNSIRISHTYGPGFDIDNDNRIIPKSIKKIVNGENIEIYKDPNSFIQYTYIADTIAGILTVLTNGDKIGTPYNVGGDELITIEDALTAMLHANNKVKSKIILKEIDSNYSFLPSKEVNFSKVDTEKLKQLGWKPMIDYKSGFKKTVNSYFED